MTPQVKPPQETPDDKTTDGLLGSDIHNSVQIGGAVAALRDIFINQDTGFNTQKRDALKLRGLLPAIHQSMELQVMRCLHQMRSKKTPLGKHIYLASLRQTNTRLFYAVVLAEPEEVLPLIYTPVVGEACQKFSQIYRRPEGLTISLEDKGNVASVVANWPVPSGAPRVAVMTDGSRILGLGDLGWNGLGIPIGKLSLYIAAAGLHPRSTIPIVLDVGTDTQKYLDDPLYLGLRRKRPSPEEYIEFVDEVMEALTSRYPNLIVQFEDFATERAFTFLERYKHTTAWNDDIQGTGAVVLGCFTSAARLASEAAKTKLQDQKVVFFGAGSAGVGVAKQLMSFFRRLGMSEDEAKDRIWLVDSKGLVTNDRGDKLPDHKIYFSRTDNEGKQFKKLIDVINYVKPTALIGLSTVPNTFDEEVVTTMSKINKRPIICPLSNPSTLSECTFEQAVNWSDGQVLFGAGSPFPEMDYKGKHYIPAQANNLFIFPGVGLAGALCKAKQITDEMITESALALADALSDEEKKEDRLLPSLTRMREISRDVAHRVIRMAERQKVVRDGGYTASKDDDELRDWIEGEMWSPTYDPLIA